MTRALALISAIALCVALAVGVSAHPAWGIVVDRHNKIYFSDIENIWKIDAQGKLTIFRSGVSGRHTHEINLDENDHLYGVDNSYEPATQRSIVALWKMTPSGEFSYLVAPTHDPPKAFTIWKDRVGNSYYVGQGESAEHQLFVLRRAPDGKVTTIAGDQKTGDNYHQAVLFNLGGTAFGSDGTLYFTDNANIRKVTTDEKLALLAGNIRLENPQSPLPDSSATRLFGIAVDAQGNAFVADYGNRRVLKVAADGRTSTLINAEPPWSPTGVALKDGDLYVLEFGFKPPSTYTPRVRKFASDGKITTLATIGENSNLGPGQSSSSASDTRTKSIPLFTYALIGVCVLALVLVIWQVTRHRRVKEILTRH